MTTDEQKTADAQIALCDKRQHMIEEGTIKSCQPLPVPILPRPDDCPSCGQKMTWLIARRGWFCLRWQCQPTMPEPIETVSAPPEQAHYRATLAVIRRCADSERTAI